jgi:hypothetical protein
MPFAATPPRPPLRVVPLLVDKVVGDITLAVIMNWAINVGVIMLPYTKVDFTRIYMTSVQ